jgi:hypothetical protein
MTIANPIAEAQGFIADFLLPDHLPKWGSELDRGARIMKALLDELRKTQGLADERYHRIEDARTQTAYWSGVAGDFAQRIEYLEIQARRAFEDTRMWDDAEIDAFLRWPQ